MRLKTSFEIIDFAEEYMAVPIGDTADSFEGVVVLSPAAAFILKHMLQTKTKEELVELVCEEYEVTESMAKDDMEHLLKDLLEMGLIEQ